MSPTTRNMSTSTSANPHLPSLQYNATETVRDAADQLPKPLARASTTFYERIISDWWWWELASWLLSFCCFSAIVGLLLYYDGKRQPTSVVKGITLNALIAIFAAIAKASMILPVSEAIGQLKWIWFRRERKLYDFITFDNATRGPWGSFMLLGTTQCR